MVFSAAAGLNGKVKVQIERVDNVKVYVYLMPNSFNSDYGTHGIFENNKIHPRTNSGIYEAPTDWSIWVVYNPGFTSGDVWVKTWAEEYTQADV